MHVNEVSYGPGNNNFRDVQILRGSLCCGFCLKHPLLHDIYSFGFFFGFFY